MDPKDDDGTTANPADGDHDHGNGDESGGSALGDAGKRALDAERKARREAEKELKALGAKLQEFESAGKSELERLSEKAAAAEADLAKFKATAQKFEVALSKGLTLTQAKRLIGETAEEFEADAEALLEDLGIKNKSAVDGGKPKEDLVSGGTNAEDEEPDYEALANKIAASKSL